MMVAESSDLTGDGILGLALATEMVDSGVTLPPLFNGGRRIGKGTQGEDLV